MNTMIATRTKHDGYFALAVQLNGLETTIMTFPSESERELQFANLHVHFCTTCQKDYPCTSEHRRIDGTVDTPPRATRRCGECLFMGA